MRKIFSNSVCFSESPYFKKLSIFGAHAAVGEFIWILGKKTDNYPMHGIIGTSGSGTS